MGQSIVLVARLLLEWLWTESRHINEAVPELQALASLMLRANPTSPQGRS